MSPRSARWRALGALGVVAALAAAALVVSALTDTGSGDPQAPTLTAPAVKPDFTARIGSPEGRPVPAGFLGFSIEFQAIRSYTGSDPRRINPVFVQLIRNLSPGQAPMIRIGGDSTDASSAPTPGIHPPPQVTYKLTPSWYATTAAAIHALGAKLTIGVNLGADQPAPDSVEGARVVVGDLGCPATGHQQVAPLLAGSIRVEAHVDARLVGRHRNGPGLDTLIGLDDHGNIQREPTPGLHLRERDVDTVATACRPVEFEFRRSGDLYPLIEVGAQIEA